MGVQTAELVPKPLVFTQVTAVPRSRAQVFDAAVKAWEDSFGQEPGAQLIDQDRDNGIIEGAAWVNYRSTNLGSREETMGVIRYHVTIQAENGQCQVRVAHVEHTGNRQAMGGGIDMGQIYSGDRPNERIPGISRGTANALHADMRTQASDRINKVMRSFSMRMRAIE